MVVLPPLYTPAKGTLSVGSTAPLVVSRAASPALGVALPPTFVKLPPMNSREPRTTTSLTLPLGAFSTGTSAPAAVSLATFLAVAPPIVVNVPPT